ncbi:MAG: hypothetical protein WAM60_21610 [Candidatus Promineifilaceae bacterium]
MDKKSNILEFRQAIALSGGLLILVGIIFLFGELFDIHLGANFWPLFIIGPGVGLFLLSLFLDEEIGKALSIVGSITTMVGFILFVHSIIGYWSSWPYSWTLIAPTSIGLGMLAYGLVKNEQEQRRAGWSLVKVGLAIFFVSAVFFEFILGLGGFDLRFGWPLLFVSLGVLLFVGYTTIPQIRELTSNQLEIGK